MSRRVLHPAQRGTTIWIVNVLSAHRVLIADDEELVRDAYRSFFQTVPDLDLVGEAADGEEAVAAYHDLRPDLTVMDLQMPRLSGIDAIRITAESDPAACLVAMTTFATRSHVVGALEAGAAGYLVKGVSGATFAAGLRKAIAGDMPLSGAVRRELATAVRAHRGTRGPVGEPVTLPPRQMELLKWLATGMTNRQIAREMRLSEGSVKQYVARMCESLAASSRTQLLVRSIQLGLVDPYDTDNG